MARIYGFLVGIVWLVFAAVAFRNSAAGWSAGASDIGFWWTVIGVLLTLAAGGALIGTWLQSTAEGWLVYELSGSSVALGFIRFANMLPFALIALWGGIIADRHSKRKILLFTQGSSMLLALVLAALVYFKLIQVWHVAAIGFLLGIVNAFDVPARQSFVVELVGRDDDGD